MRFKSLNGVYLMNSIYSLAGSFVGIFIPIYFLSLNISLFQIIWFYIVFSLAVVVFFFVTHKIIQLIGLQKTVLLSYPFLFLYFFLVYTIKQYGTPIYIIALVNAFKTALYWFPLHIWLTNMSNKKELGNDLGKFFAFSKIVGVVAPFLAALIAIYFGFESLFIFASAIYIISSIPIFLLPEFSYDPGLHFKDILTLMKSYRQYFLADVFENLREDAEGIIWPIFVYLSFKSILSIGYIGTLGAIGGAMFTLIVGKYTDQMNKKKLMLAGSIIIAVIWIIRLFATSQLSFYLLTLGVGFFEALILIPLNTVVYGLAKREGAATFILFREFPVTVGRIILYIFALLVISNVKYIFILPALAAIYFVYLSTKELETKPVNAAVSK